MLSRANCLAAAAIVVAGCTSAAGPHVLDPPPGTRSPGCAPLLEGPAFPVYPGASLVPAEGMATTLDPGLNTSVAVYHVEAPLDPVAAFYQGCGAELELVRDTIRFAIDVRPETRATAAGASAHVVLSSGPDGTRIAITCAHCY